MKAPVKDRIKSGEATRADATPEIVVWKWAAAVEKATGRTPEEWVNFRAGDQAFATAAITWIEKSFQREGRFDGGAAMAFMEWRVVNYYSRRDAAPMTWRHLTSREYLELWRRETETTRIEAEKEALRAERARIAQEKRERELAQARAKEEAELIAFGKPFATRFEKIAGGPLDTKIVGYWGLAFRAARARADSSLAAGELLTRYLDEVASGTWPAPDGIVAPDQEGLLEPTLHDWCQQGRMTAAEPETDGDLADDSGPTAIAHDPSSLLVPFPE